MPEEQEHHSGRPIENLINIILGSFNISEEMESFETWERKISVLLETINGGYIDDRLSSRIESVPAIGFRSL